mmetsp:Transcript_602/g.1231  ORF Transcript_602/g.1231 Transcript_602/m.1231 type:complete len:80 (+) Transcript_602:4574-4813(+)
MEDLKCAFVNDAGDWESRDFRLLVPYCILVTEFSQVAMLQSNYDLFALVCMISQISVVLRVLSPLSFLVFGYSLHWGDV